MRTAFTAAVAVSALVASVYAETRCVTAGWENVNPERREAYADGEAIWQADFTRKADFALELRDGAEGLLDFSGGLMTVRKTNDKGYMLVTGKPFVASNVAALRFSADVGDVVCEPEYCHAILRAWESREFLGIRREEKGLDSPGGWQVMNGLVNMPRGMFYRKYFHHKPESGAITPAIVICGRRSVSVWKNWRADGHEATKKAWRKVLEDSDARRIKAKPMGEGEFSRRIESDVVHTARIVMRNGFSALEIDGRVEPPVAFHTVYHHGDRSEIAAGGPLVENGVKIVIPIIDGGTGLRQCWDSSGYDAKKAVDVLRKTMQAGGDALYVIAYSCNAYKEFVAKDHPGEGWIAEDGKPLCGSGGSCCVGYQGMSLDKAWPWVSMASRVWRDAVNANIRAFVAEMKRQGLDKRVVGMHFCGYNDGQFGMNRPDFSAAAKAEYAKYVAGASGRSTNYYHFCRQLGVMAQEEFARTFKDAIGKDAIAIRWYDSPFVVDFALGSTLRSDAIDIVVPQPPYKERAPAIATATFTPFSSTHLHGKMLWNELDLRTWWMPSSSTAAGYREVCPADDLASWRTIYRKHAGEMIAARCGFWLYDMGRGWFAAPEIAADVGESLKTMRRLIAKKPSPWRPTVALVVDEEGFLGWDGGEHPFPEHTYNISEKQIRFLANAGVPYEFYLADDVLDRPELLDGMKTVVFMLWRKFDERRMDLARRLARRRRTLVFLSESGSLGGAKEATGFGIDFDFKSKCLAAGPVPGVDVDTLGSFDMEQIRGAGFGSDPKRPVKPPYGRRGDIAEEQGVRVLARFADDGKAAIAERLDGGCRRVYVSAPGGLSPSFFNRLARESGAYVPVDGTGLQVNMNGDFVSIHAIRGGHFDFRLPFACKVTNVKSGKGERAYNGLLPLDLTPGETCWFTLDADRKDTPCLSQDTTSSPFLFTSTACTADLWISNHTDIPGRRILLDLVGKTNFTYDAKGATLTVRDPAIALHLKDCRNVTIRNLAIDWERPVLTEARITGFANGETHVRIDRGRYPVAVKDGRLFMTGPGRCDPVRTVRFLDGDTFAPVKLTSDVFCENTRVREEPDGTIAILADYSREGVGVKVGDVVVMRPPGRPYPAIFVEDSAGVILEDVIVRDAAGMALIAQKSDGITWRGTGRAGDRTAGVIARPGAHVTANADASHFSNCRGQVTVENCWFDGMMDDAINVHSTCVQITNVLSRSSVRCVFRHHESIGFTLFEAGDHARLIRSLTNEDGPVLALKGVRRIADDVVELDFASELPAGFGVGDTLENADYQCAVAFRGNVVRNNRARGALFTTPGKVVCSSNRFESCTGPAVVMSGDAAYWFESGHCRDVEISYNVISNCLAAGYGRHGSAYGIVSINPSIRDISAQKEYCHSNIRIFGNTIFTYDVTRLFARSATGLVWSNNVVNVNGDLPSWKRPPFVLERCGTFASD